MNKSHRNPIPVNIICGPLGAGKTTVMNHLLKTRPEDERWAILINEYGLVGIDAAMVEGANDVTQKTDIDIREVAGGCICCSAGFMFRVSLVTLLQKRPDRLLIEPTGLAALSGILDTLSCDGIRESIDIRSIICILDPKRFQKDINVPTTWDQVEAADVLLANKTDLAKTEELDVFNRWAKELFPPRRHIGECVQGKIPNDLLDLVNGRETEIRHGGHAHGTDHVHTHDEQTIHNHDHHNHDHHNHDHHNHDHHNHEHGQNGQKHDDHSHPHHPESEPSASTPIVCSKDKQIIHRLHKSPDISSMGWVMWADLVFDARKLSDLLDSLWQMKDVMRLKAVFGTNEGWWRFNYVFGDEAFQKSSYRRDSRLELLIEGDALPCAKTIEKRLFECTVDE